LYKGFVEDRDCGGGLMMKRLDEIELREMGIIVRW
jgi:hypothetical protein